MPTPSRFDIRIAGPAPQVCVSRGIKPAASDRYLATSFVPREPWQAIDAETQSYLFARREAPASRTIRIVKLPPELFARVRAIRMRKLRTLGEFLPFVETPEYLELEQALVEFMQPYISSNEGFLKHSAVLNEAGPTTVTQAGPGGKLLGLHLDSWGPAPLEARDQAANRICINLGNDARYLLFISLSIETILELLPVPERALGRAVQAFLERFPETPVYRVRVLPGEAYIAPTENMIHDGSSVDQTISDLHLTARGFFRTDLN